MSNNICLVLPCAPYQQIVKCPTHHTPRDHQQVSEVMFRNICLVLPCTPYQQTSEVFYPSHSSQSPTGVSVTSKSEGVSYYFVLHFTPHNHQQVHDVLFVLQYTFRSPTHQKVCSIILSYPPHLR